MSHIEMMRVFERGLARAGVRVTHSQGYNPHPRMSLVLPRSVGVESDDELLCLWLAENEQGFDAEGLKRAIETVLPDGIEVLSVKPQGGGGVPQPGLVSYCLKVGMGREDAQVQRRIDEIFSSGNIVLERRDGRGNARIVDVRPFLKSMSVRGADILVECSVSGAGAIRIDEIMRLLGLTAGDLAQPVRRTKVEWQPA